MLSKSTVCDFQSGSFRGGMLPFASPTWFPEVNYTHQSNVTLKTKSKRFDVLIVMIVNNNALTVVGIERALQSMIKTKPELISLDWMLIHYDCDNGHSNCRQPYERTSWYKDLIKYKVNLTGNKAYIWKVQPPEDIARQYKYIWFTDLDMEISLIDIPFLFNIIKKQDALISMPAYIHPSDVKQHFILTRLEFGTANSIARVTNAIEIGCTILRTDMLLLWRDFVPPHIQTDGGIALWWCSLPLWYIPSTPELQLDSFGRACLIVDATPVIHRSEKSLSKVQRSFKDWWTPRSQHPIVYERNTPEMHTFLTIEASSAEQRKRKNENIAKCMDYLCNVMHAKPININQLRACSKRTEKCLGQLHCPPKLATFEQQ